MGLNFSSSFCLLDIDVRTISDVLDRGTCLYSGLEYPSTWHDLTLTDQVLIVNPKLYELNLGKFNRSRIQRQICIADHSFGTNYESINVNKLQSYA